jgi:exodeoxyribonuclease VIII
METTSLGAVQDMPADDYHENPAIGSSGLKRLAVSPLHYWADYLDPERERKDKKAWRIGRAWHCAVFEPGEFTARYAPNHDAHPASNKAKVIAQVLAGELAYEDLVALPEGLSKTSKEGKALVAEIEARGQTAIDQDVMDFVDSWLPKLAGKDILSADNIAGVQRMAVRMQGHPISRVVFGRYAGWGWAEKVLLWTDPVTGARCKMRPDYMLQPCDDFPNGLIIDGKSTTDAGAEGFSRQVWNLDYGLQAAFYSAGFQRVFNTRERPAFLWAAQEKESPYAAAYYAAGSDLISHWDGRIQRLLQLYVNCLHANTWPGYATSVGTLEMPAWAQKQMEVAA